MKRNRGVTYTTGQVRVAVFPGSISARVGADLPGRGAAAAVAEREPDPLDGEAGRRVARPGRPAGAVGLDREPVPAVPLRLRDGGVSRQVERDVLVEGLHAPGLPGAVEDGVDALGGDRPCPVR